MNNETYEAVQIVARLAYESGIQNGYPEYEKAIELVESWIEEVAKEYTETWCSFCKMNTDTDAQNNCIVCGNRNKKEGGVIHESDIIRNENGDEVEQ